MMVLLFLIPLAIIITFIGVYGVFWSVKNQQFDDLDGAAHRPLLSDLDDER